MKWHGLMLWLQSPRWVKMSSFSGLWLGIYMLLWRGWSYPASEQSKQLEQASRQHQQQLQLQARLQLAQPSLLAIKQQSDELSRWLVSVSPRAFSLPALLQSSGARLTHWRPQQAGGELALELSWSQFIALLRYLATLEPAPRISVLTLQGSPPRLQLMMVLRHDR